MRAQDVTESGAWLVAMPSLESGDLIEDAGREIDRLEAGLCALLDLDELPPATIRSTRASPVHG